MSSLVADLLHSSGKLAKENIVSKIETLKRTVEDIKLEFQESLRNRYIDFIPQYVKLDKIIGSLNTASNEYDVLHNQIEREIKPHMSSSVAEFHNVVEDLKKIKVLKDVVSDLAQLHQHLEGAKSFLFQSIYRKAAENILKHETMYNKINTDNKKDVDIYCALRTEYFVTKEQIIYHLQKAWQQNVTITRSKEIKNDQFRVSITFKKTSSEEIIDLLLSLKLLNYLHHTLREFGKQFLNLVCETVLSNTTEIELNNKTDISSLSIIVVNNDTPEPTQVFQKLIKIFQFLDSELFNLSLTLNEEEDAQTAMNELGSVLCDDFCFMIIEKCLKPAIPKQSRQLEDFNKEIVQAQNFNNFLSESGFLSTDNKLHHFIQGVDTLPVDKMAQDFQNRARSLMKQNLHQTITIGTEASPSITSLETTSGLDEMARTRSALSKSTFVFPRCQISVSANSLVELLHEIMEEAKQIELSYSARLYYVAHSLCDLYCYVVPTYHKNEIENIPQQTAIFHNNCMYIAHCLLTLGSRYECELRVSFPMTFIGVVPEIRKLGVDAFLTQMRHQREQLLQLLQDQEAFRNVATDEGLVNKAEKSVRQCLCQLQLLKKVWSDVLPVEVYFKSIGTLLNSCLEEIILRILSMEDITAESASQLDSIFAIFLREAPDLLKVQSADKCNLVHNYVRRWFKFQELQLILSSSLKEIVDRWASGKGPLASHFTADEVKHLIRALFQNTERRAASLAKIR